MTRRMCVVGAFALVSACGGSGGGGGPPVPPSAGTVAVEFPTRFSLTDADHVVVRGTATAPPGVTSISADGVAATTTDAFATWEATGPGVRTIARHQVVPDDTGSTVTLSIEQTGPMGAVAAMIWRRLTQHYIELEAESLDKRVTRASAA